ncbi:HAMP domain-containing protein [Microvirga tunisiensis]|uniref:histidine kinase n=2 Tax=Pannonibacter tanglangensis TaxID=2750084 RepID=A0A7X5F4B7_9HYPH|nr:MULTISPECIES: sensor histidine kinase [unclassified Pannonibacter]NBN64989.1 HAMP domain-containing protein [Pannonibacter sp. XCT-34]NBN79498.1 HAMP domain-containing protein [Pannonibacter sp. XCT-53]
MTTEAETDDRDGAAPESSGERSSTPLRRLGSVRLRRRLRARAGAFLGTYVFSSLTKRIVVLNLAGLIALVSGILYLNQFRAGLIDARVQSLLTQGEIIAGAIAASATVDTGAISVDPEKLLELQAGETLAPDSLTSLDFPVNPERVGPVLRRLISPTKTRARIYDPDGLLILDSRHLYSGPQILRFDLPPPEGEEVGMLDRMWQSMKLWMRQGDLPLYQEAGGGDGRIYPEVEAALNGSPASVVRVSQRGELIVSVAVPIQRFRAVLGTLLLSTQGGDIDAIVSAERIAIMRVFLVAAGVMFIMSVLLAGTIAGPVRRLAAAAERVRKGSNSRHEIPDFSDRQDEIGHLARAFRDMTNALYNRMDAIERFAADVAHELKNPLTSLRSAVETLPLAKSDTSRARLMEVIQHDVRRLDRLITDISDASRLDAELSRGNAEVLDVANLLRGVADMSNQRAVETAPRVILTIADVKPEKPGEKAPDKPYEMMGYDSRLAQVINNLIDNARSFSPEGGTVRIGASRKGPRIIVTVDDDGPGIRAEKIERIFERFYTDRPDGEDFGNNSGLGLSISRQIIEAHKGTITAENRTEPDPQTGTRRVTGARFVLSLPAGRPA